MLESTVSRIFLRTGAAKMIARALADLDPLREQYRKTLVGTQITVGVVTLAVLLRTQRLAAAAVFFATMQVGAILGALWAVRLKAKIERARR